MTGSFKERGALNKILTLTDEETARGVIAASAGNHAQGVAYHADAAGHAARTIVMPAATPLIKVTRTKRVRRRGGAARRQLRRGVRRGAGAGARPKG